MKKLTNLGLVLLGFVFGFLIAAILVSTIIYSILENTPKTENQEFDRVFEKVSIKVGISMSKDLPIEVKEDTELLVEIFTYQLAGLMIVCENTGTTECLMMARDFLVWFSETMIKSLTQENPKIPKNPKNQKKHIF